MHWHFNSVCTLLQYSLFHNSGRSSPAISLPTHARTLTNLDLLEWQHVKSIRGAVSHLLWVNVYLSKAWKWKLIWHGKSLHKGQMHKKGSSYFACGKRAGEIENSCRKVFYGHIWRIDNTFSHFLKSSIKWISLRHVTRPLQLCKKIKIL